MDTCSSDETPEIAQKYADVFEVYKGPNGDWNESMSAFDDAAAARQRSFELAHGKWRMWIDSDDVLPGPEEAEKLLKLNGRFNPKTPGRQVVADAPKVATLVDILKFIEKMDPDVDNISAPYLYRRDENGVGMMWQERERIVLWERGWHWIEPGHEVMVPINYKAVHKTLHLEHFLFVHEKKWTSEDAHYSIDRHHKILFGKYTNGDRSTRTLRYLNIYASVGKMQERWGEFVQEFLTNAVTQLDHYRAHIAAGNYATHRGLYHEAVAHYGAAMTLVPSMPDAWFSAGRAAEKATDWINAAQWYTRAMDCEPDFTDSDVTPREFKYALPSFAANALRELAKLQVMGGALEAAEKNFQSAVTLSKRVLDDPEVGSDLLEAQVLAAAARNDYEGFVVANGFAAIFEFLRRNDETIKAMNLLKSVPHTLLDDPRIIGLERRIAPLQKHLTDAKAYSEFYNNLDTTTDAIPTVKFSPHWLTPDGCLPRVKMLIAWLKRHPEVQKVFEYGSYDGIVSIPVLAACSNVKYTAMDANEIALNRMANEYAPKHVKDGNERLRTIHSSSLVLAPTGQDVAVLFEVIEHVPDPVKTVKDLLALLKPDGRLFISTPWGAFDRGSPDEIKKPRDPRGHVRAMLLQDFVNVVQEAGGEVEECFNAQVGIGFGDTLQAIVRKGASVTEVPRRLRPVNFYVYAALWDWNGRKVRDTGMGASEETIVYLGEKLAPDHRVKVFGPVNEEEVDRGVVYYARPKVRHADPNAPMIVSRRPSALNNIERDFGFRPKRAFLWLQDAGYDDLTPEVAAQYEKIVVLTDWHKMIMNKNHGVPLDKMVCINNFLLPEHFRLKADVRPKREPHHFIYASSPDRGLIRLLEMWPAIRREWPDATLSIFYGWDGCVRLSHVNPEWAAIYKQLREKYDKLRFQPGIEERGRINHPLLAWEMTRASAWTYPTHFAETGCLTAAKVMAAGCVPVTTPYAGLRETGDSKWTQWVDYDTEESVEAYTERFMPALRNAVALSEADRAEMSEFAIEKFDVKHALKAWLDLLKD